MAEPSGRSQRAPRRSYASSGRYADGGLSRRGQSPPRRPLAPNLRERRRAAMERARGNLTPISYVKASTTKAAKRAAAQIEEERRLYLLERGGRVRQVTQTPSPPAPTARRGSFTKKRPRSRPPLSRKQKAVQPKPDSSILGLSVEQRAALEMWIQEQRDDVHAPPVTLDSIKSHILAAFDVTIAKKNMGPLMDTLGWEYIDPGSGYLVKRARLESTQAHLQELWPLVELCSAHPNFLFCSYDESKPYSNQSKPRLWTKKGAPQAERLAPRKPGGGQVLHVSGAVCVDIGGFVQDEDGVHVGRFDDAKSGANKKSETSSTFINTLKAIVVRLQALCPGRTVVIFADCPSFHRASAEENAHRAFQLPLRTLKQKLIVANPGDKRKYNSMSKNEAAKAYSGSQLEYEELLNNIADVEAELFELGAFVLFNANSQAQLNPIERFWRAANQVFVAHGPKTLKALKVAWASVLDGQQDTVATQRRFDLSLQIGRWMFLNPGAPIPNENDVRRKDWLQLPPVPFDSILQHVFVDGKLDQERFFAMLHHANAARINGPVKNHLGLILKPATPQQLEVYSKNWVQKLRERIVLLHGSQAEVDQELESSDGERADAWDDVDGTAGGGLTCLVLNTFCLAQQEETGRLHKAPTPPTQPSQLRKKLRPGWLHIALL